LALEWQTKLKNQADMAAGGMTNTFEYALLTLYKRVQPEIFRMEMQGLQTRRHTDLAAVYEIARELLNR
jgi:hypothetical protein